MPRSVSRPKGGASPSPSRDKSKSPARSRSKSPSRAAAGKSKSPARSRSKSPARTKKTTAAASTPARPTAARSPSPSPSPKGRGRPRSQSPARSSQKKAAASSSTTAANAKQARTPSPQKNARAEDQEAPLSPSQVTFTEEELKMKSVFSDGGFVDFALSAAVQAFAPIYAALVFAYFLLVSIGYIGWQLNIHRQYTKFSEQTLGWNPKTVSFSLANVYPGNLTGVLTYLPGLQAVRVFPGDIDFAPEGASFDDASVMTNLLLLLAFGLTHSIFARKDYKAFITRFLSPRLERSTYILFSSVSLHLLITKWRAMGDTVINVSNPTLAAALDTANLICFALVIVTSVFDGFLEFTGIAQAFDISSLLNFRATIFHRYMRHPQLFLLLLTLWISPTFTVGHLMYSTVFSIYIAVGEYLKEKDLMEEYGEDYEQYKKEVKRGVCPFHM